MEGQAVGLRGEEIAVILILAMIIAGITVLWIAMANRRKLLEMAHRERLAMIERGLVPPPEVDPLAFERRGLGLNPPSRSSMRSRAAGVVLIALGLALMLLIAFAGGAPGPGLGVGGAVALVGAGFLINGLLSARDEVLTTPAAAPQPPAESSHPPGNVGP